jgi:hypothetical protein
MEKKGYVSPHERRAGIHLPAGGRPRRCEPQRASDARQPVLRGSPRLLMLNLLEDAQLSPEALKQLKERIEEAG